MESKVLQSREKMYELRTAIADITLKVLTYKSVKAQDDIIRAIESLPRFISINHNEDSETYQFVVQKRENPGHTNAYVAMFSRKGDKSLSTTNFLFKVYGYSLLDVLDRFSEAYSLLSKSKLIKNRAWCSPIKKIDFIIP